MYDKGSSQAYTTTNDNNAKVTRKVIEYIWQEPGVIQATIAWGCLHVVLWRALSKRSMGKGDEKKLSPFPSEEDFFPPTPNRLDKEAIKYPKRRESHHRPSNLQKGLPCKAPRETLYPKTTKEKKPLFPSPERLHFSVVVLTFGSSVRAVKQLFGDIRKTRGFETQNQKKR